MGKHTLHRYKQARSPLARRILLLISMGRMNLRQSLRNIPKRRQKPRESGLNCAKNAVRVAQAVHPPVEQRIAELRERAENAYQAEGVRHNGEGLIGGEYLWYRDRARDLVGLDSPTSD